MKNNRYWLHCTLTASIMLPASLLANNLPTIHDRTMAWDQHHGTAGAESITSSVTDSDGNLYVVGFTDASVYDGKDSSGGNDIFIAKYSPDGERLWSDLYGTKTDDKAFDVTIGGYDTVYLTGVTTGSLDGNTLQGGNDAFVSVYSNSGVREGTYQFGTANDEQGNGVVARSDGTVIVVGGTTGTLGKYNAGGNDAFIAYLKKDLQPIALTQIGSTANDAAQAAVLDSQENLLVVGNTWGNFDGGSNTGGNDIFLLGYDTGGIKIVSDQYGSSGNDMPYDMAIDSFDDLYIIGDTTGSFGATNAGYTDAFLLKIAQEGSWVRQFGGIGIDRGYAVAVDAENEVFVVGAIYGSFDGKAVNGLYDGYIAKYDRAGSRLWSKLYGEAGTEGIKAISNAGNGTLYVSGDSDGNLGDYASAGLFDNFMLRVDPVTTEITYLTGGDAPLGDYDATDIDGDSVTFGVSGTDASSFTIDPSTGVLNFADVPQTTQPGDSDGDNVYDIEVTASDGIGTTTLPLQVTVTDPEAPLPEEETPPFNPALIMYLLN